MPAAPRRDCGGFFYAQVNDLSSGPEARALPRPPSLRRGLYWIQPERGAPQVHVLSELASAGTISVALSQAPRVLRIVLDHRFRCMRLEFLRELVLNPASQPAQAATARHAARRRRRS